MFRGIGVLALFLLVVIIIIPAVLVRGCDFRSPDFRPQPVPVGAVTINVLDVQTGEVIELGLEQYIEGVVAGEMPALFHSEALKAQAIAARTYAIRKMRRFGGAGDDRNLAADISNDPTRDQAWLPDERLKERWGLLNYYRYRSKIAEAVQATAGLILTYQGDPATPAYHSTCGGYTENSEDVWTYEVPYLRSVRCDYCGHSPHYQGTATLPLTTVITKIGLPAAAKAEAVEQALAVKAKSSTGRVKLIQAGDKLMRGLEFRMLLGLATSNLTWKVTDTQIIFTTQGYGHGVGMCQYGADGMGQAGKTVNDILALYFQGAQVSQMFAE